jgi:hypothetical protein
MRMHGTLIDKGVLLRMRVTFAVDVIRRPLYRRGGQCISGDRGVVMRMRVPFIDEETFDPQWHNGISMTRKCYKI